MKKNQIMDIVLAAVVILMGILIIIDPTKMLQLAITIVGVFLIVVGVLRLIVYAQAKVQNNADVVVSIIYLALGVVFLVFTGFIMEIAKIFAILFSILLMISLLVRLVVTIMNRQNNKHWLVGIIVSALLFALSVVLMVFAITSEAEVVYQIIGGMILVEGLVALLEALFPPKVVVTVVDYDDVVDADVEIKD